MAKTILVTGGAGFIGSHTVDLLISKGYHVIVVDNISTGAKHNLNKKAKFILTDIRKINKHLKKLKNVDAVLHFASQISVTNSIRDPANDLSINAEGSINLLDMCKDLGIGKFVFASSCAVYGLSPHLPVGESNNVNPQNPYAISKRAVEMYMDFYSQAYGINCTSLRYANVYGPRQSYLGEAGVVTVFINNILRNQKPVIFGDGHQTRDFVYVADVAEANLKVLEQNKMPKAVNIGTNTQITINSLLEKLTVLMNKHNIEPLHKKARKGEVRFSSLDIKLANNELGWKPKKNLDEGLKETIGWFKLKRNL